MKNNSKMTVIGVLILTLAMVFVISCSNETDPPVVNVDVDHVNINKPTVTPPKDVSLISISSTEYRVIVSVVPNAVSHRLFVNNVDNEIALEVTYTQISYYTDSSNPIVSYIINANDYKFSTIPVLSLKDYAKIRFGACSVDKDGNTSEITYSNILTQ